MKRWKATEFAPTCSLGWELARIWAREFPSPRDENQPFILTAEQHANLVEWYSLHEVTGEFIYRRGQSRRAKGTGKSPIEAAKCVSELALDVRFDGWGADGRPVGRPWGTGGDPDPWIQIAALSEDQDENTYTPLYTFLTGRDGHLADLLNVDAGLTRCLLRTGGGKIEPVTSRAGSKEGQPLTYGNVDESGLMIPSNGGVKLALTIRRNAAKMGGRSYETTNGYKPGERSVAEATDKAALTGRGGIFLDSVEAPRTIRGVEVNLDAPDEILEEALDTAYAGCWWVDRKRLVADIRDDDMPWADSERFFFNWNKKSEDQAFDVNQWDRLADKERVVPDGERIGLGFVGAISGARTVLLGCTADRHLFAIDSWSRPPNATNWRVPRQEVHDAVARTIEQYSVGLFYGDPAKWHSELEFWAAEYAIDGYERLVAIDTNSPARFASLCDRFVTAVEEGGLTHDGNTDLRDAISASSKRTVQVKADESDGRSRFVLVRTDTRRIDDACVAVLALAAAEKMPEEIPHETPEIW